MPQVVRGAGQRRGHLLRREGEAARISFRGRLSASPASIANVVTAKLSTLSRVFAAGTAIGTGGRVLMAAPPG